MATRVIDDTKLQSIAVAIQGKDGGGQMTVDEMPGRIANLKEKGIIWAEVNASGLPIKVDAYVNELPYYSFAVTGNYNSNTYRQCREIIVHEGCSMTWGYAFYHNTSLIKTVLPTTLTIINTEDFSHCTNLSNLMIHGELTYIGNYAFQYCESLPSIPFLQHVKHIGVAAFYKISNVTDVKIYPLDYLGASAFSSNPQMDLYDFTEWSISDIQNCTFGTNVFGNVSVGTVILFATQEIAEAAKQETNLSVYGDWITYEGA